MYHPTSLYCSVPQHHWLPPHYYLHFLPLISLPLPPEVILNTSVKNRVCMYSEKELLSPEPPKCWHVEGVVITVPCSWPYNLADTSTSRKGKWSALWGCIIDSWSTLWSPVQKASTIGPRPSYTSEKRELERAWAVSTLPSLNEGEERGRRKGR